MLPPIPDNRSYLSPRQVEDMQGQEASLLRQIENPSIEDKGALRTRILSIKRSLAEDSPPVLTGQDLDAAVKEEKRLAAKIRSRMLSHEEMMRAPRGAAEIEAKLQQEMGPDFVRYKNIRRITHPGDTSLSVTDIDELRPAHATLPMTEAMIPRKRLFMDMAGLGDRYEETFPAPDGETLQERLVRIEAMKRETEAAILASGETLPHPGGPAPKGPRPSPAA